MIELLPESSGSTLIFKASVLLTDSDYKETFIPLLDKAMHTYGTINVLLLLDESFEGWELEAMWDDAKFGMEHKDDFDKIAVVGASEWMNWAINIAGHFMEGQMKTFPASNFEEALSWINA